VHGLARTQAHIDTVCGVFVSDRLVLHLPAIQNSAMLVLGFPLGFFTSGSFSPIAAFFTELFSTSLRASGQGFAYNQPRASRRSALPTLVGFLSEHVSLGHSIAVFAISAYLLMTLGVLTLPETRGAELVDI
jgi:hypothetical protein